MYARHTHIQINEGKKYTRIFMRFKRLQRETVGYTIHHTNCRLTLNPETFSDYPEPIRDEKNIYTKGREKFTWNEKFRFVIITVLCKAISYQG